VLQYCWSFVVDDDVVLLNVFLVFPERFRFV
jgi:hypothetical protein